jgi:hypothetical protein
MARGQSQRSSQAGAFRSLPDSARSFPDRGASVRSELGESTILSKKSSKVVNSFPFLLMIEPTGDGSSFSQAGIDAGKVLKAIKEIDFGSKFRRGEDYEYQAPEDREQDEKRKSESVGVMTDILELNYLKQAKALTLSYAEGADELTPDLTRAVNARYNPKIKELESSIEDGFRKGNGFNADISHIESSLKKIAQNIESQRGTYVVGKTRTPSPDTQIIGAYKQGDMKKLFNDIYDTLNS